MAQAILELRPGTKLGFGPPIEDGFYYDFILSEPIGEDDFKAIEKAMYKIINQDQVFEEENLPKDEALARIDEMGEPYKKEYAEELFETREGMDSLRFFRNGPFLDMCEGPHVESTKKIPAARRRTQRDDDPHLRLVFRKQPGAQGTHGRVRRGAEARP